LTYQLNIQEELSPLLVDLDLLFIREEIDKKSLILI